jgi:hypothetical protein
MSDKSRQFRMPPGAWHIGPRESCCPIAKFRKHGCPDLPTNRTRRSISRYWLGATGQEWRTVAISCSPLKRTDTIQRP